MAFDNLFPKRRKNLKNFQKSDCEQVAVRTQQHMDNIPMVFNNTWNLFVHCNCSIILLVNKNIFK